MNATLESIRWDVGYRVQVEQQHVMLAWLLTLVEYGFDVLRRAQCRMFGHLPVDHSHATPECGWIDIECMRCGKTLNHHWLY